jgi:hypothetical protein
VSIVKFLQRRLPQQDFLKRYELLDEKGKGKNSHVWRAWRKSDKKVFAVKIQKQVN